ncbi:MAG: hypothetical protein WC654_05830 [Patescibacteria group bacterium]
METKMRQRINIPLAWKKAAGLLRGRKIDPVGYQKKIRKEWESRLEKLTS